MRNKSKDRDYTDHCIVKIVLNTQVMETEGDLQYLRLQWNITS